MLKYVAVFKYFYSDGIDSRTGNELFIDRDVEEKISAGDDANAIAQMQVLLQYMQRNKSLLPKRGHSPPSRVELVKLVQVTERIVLI